MSTPSKTTHQATKRTPQLQPQPFSIYSKPVVLDRDGWGSSQPVWQGRPNYHQGGPGWEPARLGANDHRRWPSRGLV